MLFCIFRCPLNEELGLFFAYKEKILRSREYALNAKKCLQNCSQGLFPICKIVLSIFL